MSPFETKLLRLKQAVGLSEDQDVATLLGMTKAAMSARKKRDAFPEDKLYALQARRPELRLDVQYVLTGRSAARGAAAAAAKVGAGAQRKLAELAPAEAVHVPRVHRAREEDAVLYRGDEAQAQSEEQQLLADLRRCSPGDRQALRHLAARLAELRR